MMMIFCYCKINLEKRGKERILISQIHLDGTRELSLHHLVKYLMLQRTEIQHETPGEIFKLYLWTQNYTT